MPVPRPERVRVRSIGRRASTVPGRAWSADPSEPQSLDRCRQRWRWSPLSAVGSIRWRILVVSEPEGVVERGLANFQPDRGLSQGLSLRDHAAGAGQFLGVDGSRPPLRPHAAHHVRPDRDLDPRPYAQDSQRRLRSGRHRAARWRRLARRGAGRAIMAEVQQCHVFARPDFAMGGPHGGAPRGAIAGGLAPCDGTEPRICRCLPP